MNEQTKELLENTYTKDNLHRKVQLLEEFFEYYFFAEHQEGSLKDNFKNFLIDEHVGEYMRNSLLSLSDEFFSRFNRDNFRDIFHALKDAEHTMPHITMYVATILPPIEVEKLGKWVRQQISPQIFIDLEVDAQVIGGCAFVWNGVYHDYSLAYYIDKHKKEIRSLLTST